MSIQDNYDKVITECILSKIKRLPKVTDVTEKEFVFRHERKKYYISKWDYIYFYYQIIDMKDKLFDLFDPALGELKSSVPSLIETVYKLALGESEDPNNWCTGQISLLEGKILKTKNRIFYYEKDEYSFNEFLEAFSTYLANCKFTSLALTYSSTSFSHRNMILIYRNPLKNKFFLYLYEPEGIVQKDVREFLEYLISKFNDTFELKLEADTGVYPKTCPLIPVPTSSLSVGLQMLLLRKGIEKKERKGYCVMYSYFWMYLVLSCSKDGINPLKLMNTVEFYLEKTFTEKELGDIIVSFASYLVNFYITDLQNYLDKSGLNAFHGSTTEMFNYLMQRTKQYERKSSLKKPYLYLGEDGDPCNQNSECGSNYCDPISKICGPSELDEPTQLPSLTGPRSDVDFQQMSDSDIEDEQSEPESESDIDM